MEAPPLLFPRLQVIHPGQVGSEPQWQHENDTAFNKRSVKKKGFDVSESPNACVGACGCGGGRLWNETDQAVRSKVIVRIHHATQGRNHQSR